MWVRREGAVSGRKILIFIFTLKRQFETDRERETGEWKNNNNKKREWAISKHAWLLLCSITFRFIFFYFSFMFCFLIFDLFLPTSVCREVVKNRLQLPRHVDRLAKIVSFSFLFFSLLLLSFFFIISFGMDCQHNAHRHRSHRKKFVSIIS